MLKQRTKTAVTAFLAALVILCGALFFTGPAFAENTLKDCTLEFTFPDYAADKEGRARILSYSVQHEDHGLYAVSIEMEVLP